MSILRNTARQARITTTAKRSFAIPRLPAVPSVHLRQLKMSQSFTSNSAVSTSNPQNEYLVVIPDFAGTQSQRAEAQPKHIEAAMPLIDAGQLTYFGVTLAKHVGPNEDHKPNIVGSTIVMKAGSEEEIRHFLNADAYTKAGVWNVKAAQIWPFKSG